jgi:DNA-binding NtrC family response regulator
MSEEDWMIARILIIDDEPRWLEFARHGLGTKFEIDVATDLRTALARLKENKYDLIIASSRCTGVLETIRRRYPEKRMVVATGQPTTSEAIDMYRFGAMDYFAKDLRVEVVSEKIREAINKPVKPPV